MSQDSGSLVVAALGDSITTGAPLWEPVAERREAGRAYDERSQWMHWAARRDPRLRFANHGVNTQDTGAIAARLDAAVAGADALVVQGGVNDLVHSKPLEQAASNLDAMVARGLALGLRVALCELIPNNGYPALDADIRERRSRDTGASARCSPRCARRPTPGRRRGSSPRRAGAR